jgi:hypothetical protein
MILPLAPPNEHVVLGFMLPVSSFFPSRTQHMRHKFAEKLLTYPLQKRIKLQDIPRHGKTADRR